MLNMISALDSQRKSLDSASLVFESVRAETPQHEPSPPFEVITQVFVLRENSHQVPEIYS